MDFEVGPLSRHFAKDGTRHHRLCRIARDYLAGALEEGGFQTDQRRFGVELEFSIVDDAFLPILGSARTVWEQLGEFPVVQELGSFQIEVNPPPEALGPASFQRLHRRLSATVSAMEGPCGALGGRLLPIGLAPRMRAALFDDPRFFADTVRYRASTAYARRHRQEARLRFARRQPLILPHGSAVAMINELHVHIQALSADEIGPLFEAAEDVTPLLSALGANSGWFDGEPLRYLDHQVRLFAESERRPPSPRKGERVGLYPRTFDGPLAYFDWIAQFPIWAEPEEADPRATYQAIEKGYCGWVRLRVDTLPAPSLRVELRVPSSQPTLRENVALAEFAVRSVLARTHAGLPPLDHRLRRINLERCARDGLAATVFWDDGSGLGETSVATVIDVMLDAIGEGEYLALLATRLRRRLVPAQLLASESGRLGAVEALRAYHEHFQADELYIGGSQHRRAGRPDHGL